jgi:hypothetical protein
MLSILALSRSCTMRQYHFRSSCKTLSGRMDKRCPVSLAISRPKRARTLPEAQRGLARSSGKSPSDSLFCLFPPPVERTNQFFFEDVIWIKAGMDVRLRPTIKPAKAIDREHVAGAGTVVRVTLKLSTSTPMENPPVNE